MEPNIDVPRACSAGKGHRLARPYLTTETAPSVDAYDGKGDKRGKRGQVTQH